MATELASQKHPIDVDLRSRLWIEKFSLMYSTKKELLNNIDAVEAEIIRNCI
jgi:hypothetical protein